MALPLRQTKSYFEQTLNMRKTGGLSSDGSPSLLRQLLHSVRFTGSLTLGVVDLRGELVCRQSYPLDLLITEDDFALLAAPSADEPALIPEEPVFYQAEPVLIPNDPYFSNEVCIYTLLPLGKTLTDTSRPTPTPPQTPTAPSLLLSSSSSLSSRTGRI